MNDDELPPGWLPGDPLPPLPDATYTILPRPRPRPGPYPFPENKSFHFGQRLLTSYAPANHYGLYQGIQMCCYVDEIALLEETQFDLRAYVERRNKAKLEAFSRKHESPLLAEISQRWFVWDGQYWMPEEDFVLMYGRWGDRKPSKELPDER